MEDPIVQDNFNGFDADAETIKIQELMGRIEELETTLKNKDDTITNLQGEVERLNTEIKSKSVPSRKPNAGAGAVDNKARTGPAARKPAQPKPAPTKPNGVAAKKSTMTGASPARKPAAGGAGRPKTAPAKTPASRPGTAKKAGKGPRAERGAEGASGKASLQWVDIGKDGEKEHAVKLFLRGRGVVCYPPTDFTLDSVDAGKPEQKLKIDWVYGYRGRDAQDNIYCLPSNELLYYQAAVGVIYNPETKTQRFYQGHNDDIRCIALNPADPNIVATGQAAGHDEKEGQPHVRVWNCETLETLSVFGAGVFQRGVGSVSFSPDGKYVMAVDEGNDHTIYIYEWSKKHKVASQKGHGDPVLGAEYLPSSNSRFVTYGKGHILFWELEGGKLVKKSGLFEKNAKPRFVTSLAFTASGEPVTGDSNGNLFKWSLNDRKIIKAINGAHQGTIYSLAIKENDIYTGGQDCKVKRFSDTDMTEQDCWALDGDKHGRVKAITFVGEKLAVGTYNNGILFGLFGDEPEQILYGHGAGDLWGGADHPLENSFATVGQDKVVYIWDATTHTPKHVFSVEKPGQACAFSPCGSVLAVATTTGEWYVLDATTGDKLSSYVSGDEQIDAIAFSPDGKQIAVGSHDNFVYLFDSSNLKGEYSQTGKCTGHSSFITHLDFSEDGKIIQTTSGDYEHLYWEAETGEQITSSKDQRDTNMASYTCILGFPVCGIWPIGYDGTDINSLCRSKDGKLLVTADDFGLVNLFRYPCCNPNAEWSSFRGHSAHVTKVRFLKDDTSVISLGGRDQSIIQWAIE